MFLRLSTTKPSSLVWLVSACKISIKLVLMVTVFESPITLLLARLVFMLVAFLHPHKLRCVCDKKVTELTGAF